MGAQEPQKAFDADRNRGIRNASVKVNDASARFIGQREGETTSADLIRKGERGRLSFAPNDPRYDTNDPSSNKAPHDAEYRSKGSPRNQRFNKNRMGETVRLNEELERLAKEGDLSYEADDSKLLLENAPEKPQFPTVMLTLALLKDLFDAVDATLILIVLTTVLSFVISLVLFLWILGKMGGGWWKRKIIKKLWVKWGIATVIEFIPLGKIIPATTIFVLMVHYDESKIVRVLNGALSRMR
jgi:hypothetical protein